MQNRYTGDIGDFAKYGLMRQFGNVGFRLALAWDLFPDEGHNSDGNHIAYLGRPEFRNCDPDLHDQIERLVSGGQRNITAIEKSKILGAKTLFHSEELDLRDLRSSSGKMGRQKREDRRETWLSDCVAETKGADVVLFDPDNGLEGSKPKPLTNKGPKFLYWSDLEPFIERNQSLIIYNHATRQGTIYEQIARRLSQIKDHVPYGANAVAMLWRRFSVRYFIVVPTDGMNDRCVGVCEKMGSGPWGQTGFFELVRGSK